jgi:hypothetical protein
VAGDDFALAVMGDADGAWDIDAVLAAVAATWPRPTSGTAIDSPAAGSEPASTYQTHRSGRSITPSPEKLYACPPLMDDAATTTTGTCNLTPTMPGDQQRWDRLTTA